MTESSQPPKSQARPDEIHWGVAYLREDLQEVRQDMRHHREETQQQFQAAREETQQQFQAARKETQQQFTSSARRDPTTIS